MNAPDIADLYTNHRDAIFMFIRRRVLQPGTSYELAEDITQECFRKALEAIQNGTKVTHASGWLFQIARNLIIDHYRSKSSHAPMVQWDEVWYEPVNEPSPHELAEQAITCQRVRRAVNRLREGQRIVLTRRMEGYEFDEIADEMGKPFGAVKQLNARGYACLRLWLKEAA